MANRFDERYEFRIAKTEDIEAIQEFLDTNWKKGHILVKHRDYLEYEFLEENGDVNFVLAIDKDKKSIEGILGFLKASKDKDNLDIWGSIWKTLDGNMPMLGCEIVNRRKELTGCRNSIGVGDNPKTAIPVLKKLLRKYTAKMEHYYLLRKRDDYTIAKMMYYPETSIDEKQYEVVKLDNINILKDEFNCEDYKEYIPYKDYWYIEHRYYNHPVYNYELYGVKKDGKVKALLVFRRQEYENRVAIRMIDYIGDRTLISGIGLFLNKLVEDDERNEYIDFYCSGINPEEVKKAGFALRKDDDENIIPNYFGPFLQANIDIWVDSTDSSTLFCKADADQDRPNVI